MSCNATFARKHSGKWTTKESRNGTRTKSKPGVKPVAYCPLCPQTADRGFVKGRVSVRINQRVAVCREGHSFSLRTRSPRN